MSSRPSKTYYKMTNDQNVIVTNIFRFLGEVLLWYEKRGKGGSWEDID